MLLAIESCIWTDNLANLGVDDLFDGGVQVSRWAHETTLRDCSLDGEGRLLRQSHRFSHGCVARFLALRTAFATTGFVVLGPGEMAQFRGNSGMCDDRPSLIVDSSVLDVGVDGDRTSLRRIRDAFVENLAAGE